MLKTTSQLNAGIDQAIKLNGNGEITGPVLNTVLKSLTESFGSSYFLYPKDASVTAADVGKLLMNDGSGTAKVYQLSAATPAETGRFVITFNSLDDLEEDSEFIFSDLINRERINRTDWRAGATPATAFEEMQLLEAYLNSSPVWSSTLTASTASGVLVVEELAYNGTRVEWKNVPATTLVVDTVSKPALPAAPSAFPLGKLLAIEGTNAVISSRAVETFTEDGTISVNNDYFNYATDIDFTSTEVLEGIATSVVVPGANGTVTALNPDDFDFDETYFASFRHHIVGVALTTAGGQVTVLNLSNVSFLWQFIVRLISKSVFQAD